MSAWAIAGATSENTIAVIAVAAAIPNPRFIFLTLLTGMEDQAGDVAGLTESSGEIL